MAKKSQGKPKTSSAASKLMHGILLVLALYFLYTAFMDIQTFISLQLSIQSNTEKQEEVLEEKESLETTKSNLTNPDYVEYLARGKYLVTKEGEQIFKFPTIDKSASND